MSSKGSKPEATDFIQMVAEALEIDVSDTRRLALRLGVDSRYITRWRNGEHAPSLRVAIDALRSSGLLASPDPISRPENDGAAEMLRLLRDMDLRLQRLEGRVALASDVEEGLDALRAAIDSVASARSRPAARSR